VVDLFDDGDGVPPQEENGAPNGGDGNGDSTLDSFQNHVASLVSTSGSYMTLLVDPACTLSNVMAVDPASLPADPLSSTRPQGLIAFDLTLGPGCPSPVEVTVIYHGESELSAFSYRKYGPEPGDLSDHWYTVAAVFGTTTVGGGPVVATATFSVFDGGPGDRVVGTPDGQIFDPGGPALLVAGPNVLEIPTLSELGSAMLILLLLLVGVAILRRGP